MARLGSDSTFHRDTIKKNILIQISLFLFIHSQEKRVVIDMCDTRNLGRSSIRRQEQGILNCDKNGAIKLQWKEIKKNQTPVEGTKKQTGVYKNQTPVEVTKKPKGAYSTSGMTNFTLNRHASMRDATMCQKCMDKIINSVSKKGDSGCLTASNMTKPNPRPAHQVAAATSIPTVSGVLMIGIGSRSARGGYMCSKESAQKTTPSGGTLGPVFITRGNSRGEKVGKLNDLGELYKLSLLGDITGEKKMG
eukprot:scaffold38392_cov74-Cyclotella_meneghiniana.AAC.1